MLSDFIDKLKVEFQKLNFDFKDRIKFSSNDGITYIKLPTCTIKIYESNYGYKLECDICFKGYEIDMPMTQIKIFEDSINYKIIDNDTNALIELIKFNVEELLETKKAPNWYLSWVDFVKFFKDVRVKLVQLKLSDPLRVKWLNREPSWKIDFKRRFPDISHSGNDFFWSRM